ncbi:MAG: Uma2 family endonuclease [Cytophagales bacterium]|nr:Uma2 family endonuclease [Cytophagales bacterium]
MDAVVSKRMITASEYHQMGEVGIIRPEERVELINGEIITMSPKGTKHAKVVRQLTKWFYHNHVDGPFEIIVQDPIVLSDHSEPEPDLAITNKTDGFEHPKAQDVVLVIEVADTSLLYDTTTKLELYAAEAIPEYWVVDIENVRVFVFSEPAQGTYQKSATYYSSDTIQYQRLTLEVRDIIPQKQV